MRWAHLPRPGGIADQAPDLVEGFRHIFIKRDEIEERNRKEEEGKIKRQQGARKRR